MDLIDIRQLQAFHHLAREGSFTAAAKKMFVTQSAISHSMKALEDVLETQLLDRSGKKVSLTAEGEVLFGYADRILGEMRSAIDEVKTMGRFGYGRLRVAAPDTLCQHLLPAVIREFRESFPHCEVNLRSADTGEALSLLVGGEVDLTIAVSSGRVDRGVEMSPLFRDDLVFVVSPDHPWATEPPCGTADLAMEHFLIYGRRSVTRRLIDATLAEAGLHHVNITELGNMGAICELSKIGVGVGLVARWVAARDVAEGTLLEVVPPMVGLERQWGLFHRSGGVERPIAMEVFEGISKTVARGIGGQRGEVLAEGEES